MSHKASNHLIQQSCGLNSQFQSGQNFGMGHFSNSHYHAYHKSNIKLSDMVFNSFSRSNLPYLTRTPDGIQINSFSNIYSPDLFKIDSFNNIYTTNFPANYTIQYPYNYIINNPRPSKRLSGPYQSYSKFNTLAPCSNQIEWIPKGMEQDVCKFNNQPSLSQLYHIYTRATSDFSDKSNTHNELNSTGIIADKKVLDKSKLISRQRFEANPSELFVVPKIDNSKSTQNEKDQKFALEKLNISLEKMNMNSFSTKEFMARQFSNFESSSLMNFFNRSNVPKILRCEPEICHLTQNKEIKASRLKRIESVPYKLASPDISQMLPRIESKMTPKVGKKELQSVSESNFSDIKSMEKMAVLKDEMNFDSSDLMAHHNKKSPKEVIRATNKRVNNGNPVKISYPKTLGAHIVEKDNIHHFLFNIPKHEIINKSEYKIVSEVSKGSFGLIYAAYWKGQFVAIKRSHGKMTLEAMRSIVREINSYRKLKHPRVVEYYGVCLDPTFLCIVTEYLPGGNLFDALYYDKLSLDSTTRIKLAHQLIQVVEYLHKSKNIIHRDIKTANLILDNKKNLKLCDFGKSRELNSERKVKLEENGGSPRYMAPECFVAGNEINEKADIWSIGCCLIEIFGGPVPFESMRSNKDVVRALLVDKQIPTVPTWFHPKLKSIVNKCLVWQFSKRTTTEQIENDLLSLNSKDLDFYEANHKGVYMNQQNYNGHCN